jgi:GntR family transcriptional regulator
VFTLNPHSGVPIYRQLLDQARRMVAGGQLAAGTELPSIRDLALKHAVNPMTISKAYSMLEAEGLLERHRGKPMTVAPRSRIQSLPTKRVRQLDPHINDLITAARQLQLSQGEVIKAVKAKWESTDELSTHRSAAAK